MLVVQPRRLPWSLSVDEAIRSLRVELERPVANDLQRHPADLGRLAPRGPVIHGRKSQQSPRLRPVFRTLGRRPHSFRVIVIPKSNRRPMANPSCPPQSNQNLADSGILPS